MRKSRDPVWTKPKEEDLMLLWNSQLQKHHGRKLESHWSELHRLVKINLEGISGMVSKSYGDQDYPELISIPATVSFSREAMNRTGFPRQRAVDLSRF